MFQNKNVDLLVREENLNSENSLEKEIKRLKKEARRENLIFESGTKMLTNKGEVVSFYIGVGFCESSKVMRGIEEPKNKEQVLSLSKHFFEKGIYQKDMNGEKSIPLKYKHELFKVKMEGSPVIEPLTNKGIDIIADEVRTLTIVDDDLKKNIDSVMDAFNKKDVEKALERVKDDNYIVNKESSLSQSKIELNESHKNKINDFITNEKLTNQRVEKRISNRMKL